MRALALRSLVLAAAALGCAVSTTSTARAQADTNPPLPNALLLVDTSGSMEYMIGTDATGKPRLPTCNPGNPASTNEQNRWATLVSVLTGEPQDYSCYPQPRVTGKFTDEYKLGGTVDPGDKGYYLPYHRIVSGNCVMGPDQASWPVAGGGGVFAFPPNALKPHKYDDPLIGCAAPFKQYADGLMDAFSDNVRFGLMTFDSNTGAQTGLVAPDQPNHLAGTIGGWSYFPNWHTGGGNPAQGNPELCNTPQGLEVGARNPAAPPWEGKLVGFGDPTASSAALVVQNDKIQRALLALRPFGATPTAGMMADAEYFFRSDPMLDPSQGNKPFGPKDDPFINQGCRDAFIVLLTDGAPNLDLRAGCANNPPPPGGCPWAPGGVCPQGTCPYRRPWETALALAQPAVGRPIKTFVVGFAVSTIGPNGPTQIKCDQITPTGSPVFDPGGKCSPPIADEGLAACCELSKVAFYGGTMNARFADDKVALRKALNDIFNQIASKTTTRTLPVFTSGVGAINGTYQFYSSFFVQTGGMWSGVLERKRETCTGVVATPQTVDKNYGDQFHENVSVNDPAHPRYFYSVLADPVGNVYPSTGTIRGIAPGSAASPGPPTVGADGLGAASGSWIQGKGPDIIPIIPPGAVEVISGATSTCTSSVETLTPTQCRDRILKWNLGLPTGHPFYTREGSPFGAIYHATPTVVGPPGGFVRDPTYVAFRATKAARPVVLYSVTTDGQLHAFKVAEASGNDKFQNQNNEMWSFMPPTVLPGLKTLYPGVQQTLLDGTAVVKELKVRESTSQAINASAAGTGSAWATVLAAGFGPRSAGYYALDVTDPEPVVGQPASGPKFLWQLVTDELGNRAFGRRGTPALTTLVLDTPNGKEAVAVAILPGGDSDPVDPNGAPDEVATLTTQSLMAAPYSPRTLVRKYGPTDPSRSLTIVRVDNGEVIRRFSPLTVKNSLSPLLANRTTTAPFDAPIAGVPVPYPAGAGSIASRAYVGDREGRMWRVDLSSTNPQNWKVELFWDGFPKPKALPATGGQPVHIEPTISVDTVGNPVVIFSTGDQDSLAPTPALRNVVWSIKETSGLAGQLQTVANWHLGFGDEVLAPAVPGVSTSWVDGQRVTGPISIFNGAVYFSTFRPPALTDPNVCALGSSVLWGVDFVHPVLGTEAPVGRLGTLGEAAEVIPDSILFGVGITRGASCFNTQAGGASDDPYLGFGNGMTVGDTAAPQYKLVLQTGPKTGSTPGGQQKTNIQERSLKSPASLSQLGSWAGVID